MPAWWNPAFAKATADKLVYVYPALAFLNIYLFIPDGRMVELVYTYASGAYGSNPVRVRVSLRPPRVHKTMKVE